MKNGEGKIRKLKIQSDEMTKPILQDISDSDLSDVVKFFLIFSRFEYALKRSGFLPEGEEGKNIDAQADWSAFAKSIQSELAERKRDEEGLSRAIDYLIGNPPGKQIVKRGDSGRELGRKSSKPTGSEAEVLSTYIRRVRNNLFHGVKYPFDHAQDLKLIQNANIVLKHFLDLDAASKVKKCYEGRG